MLKEKALLSLPFFFFRGKVLVLPRRGFPDGENGLFLALRQRRLIFLLSASFFWRSEGRNRSMLSSR